LPCADCEFQEVDNSLKPTETVPDVVAGAVYGPWGLPQPSAPAGWVEVDGAPVPPAPLVAVPLVAAPLVAGALLAEPLLAAALEPAADVAELDEGLACPGELVHAAKTNADAATKAVSVTARVLVMKDPPEGHCATRQRRPPSTVAFCGLCSHRVVSDRQTLRTFSPSGPADNRDRHQKVTGG